MEYGFYEEEYVEQNFHGWQVSGETIREKAFSEFTFTRCNLSGNDFEGCTFYRCTFRACDLSLSRVNNCSFIETTFKDCKLVGINWTDAYWPKGRLLPTIDFESCALNHSVFMGLALSKMKLIKCTAREVDFPKRI